MKNRSEIMTQAPTLTGQDIGEAEGAVRALLEGAITGAGITANDYIVLRVLAARGPFARPAALHEFLAGQRQLGLDRPAVADLLARLEAQGLVAGTAPDVPGPARLTAEGTARHTRLAEAVAPRTRQLFAGFDPDDLATAHRVLAQVVERADHLAAELQAGQMT
jgi:DNA-binding MarR family transcriptional regulator